MTFHGSVSHNSGNRPEHWIQLRCGHCGVVVSAAIITHFNANQWLLCPNCGKGSVMVVIAGNWKVFPGAVFGPELQGLPDAVASAYEEARQCLAVNAFTACELICRKILMHVAVDKGAAEGNSFQSYLTYLGSTGYITPPMQGWADLIRQNGNESTHLVAVPPRERVENTVMFTAELLRLVYEMEFLRNKYSSSPTP